MGGKKKRFLGLNNESVIGKAANIAVKGSTGGAVSTDGSGWGEKIARGEEVGVGDMLSITHGGAMVQEGMSALASDAPKLPDAEDPLIQQKKADEEAKARVAKEIGTRGMGLASTILGGSLNQEAGILRKKKLLGE